MDIGCDFSDVDSFFEQGKREVRAVMESEGAAAVEDAKQSGSYKDHTGNLRKSNSYEVNNNELVLKNTAEYASCVEAKGFEVLGNSALRAEKRLKERFE